MKALIACEESQAVCTADGVKEETDDKVSVVESCGATGLPCCKCNPGGCNCREEHHD